ncbi:MAG: type II toxin-antitoxin system PrlF family antitoxin [Phormidesmis sp.]
MTETLFAVAESTLTDRYQTTVPSSVRKALGLSKQDKIAYHIGADGKVYIARAEEEDPVLEKFLAFLAKDIEQNPQNLKPIDADLIERARSLVVGMDSDLDAPLSDEDG